MYLYLCSSVRIRVKYSSVHSKIFHERVIQHVNPLESVKENQKDILKHNFRPTHALEHHLRSITRRRFLSSFVLVRYRLLTFRDVPRKKIDDARRGQSMILTSSNLRLPLMTMFHHLECDRTSVTISFGRILQIHSKENLTRLGTMYLCSSVGVRVFVIFE